MAGMQRLMGTRSTRSCRRPTSSSATTAAASTPHVRTELLLDGYTPPPPVKQIDLMQVVKRQFRLEYNNLGSVTTALGVETKLETGGFDLWKACIAGDPGSL